jgi:uncharacterized membrane protein
MFRRRLGYRPAEGFLMENKSDARAKKKAEFSEPPLRKSKTSLILLTVFVVLVGIGAYMVFSASNDNPSTTTIATTPASTPSNSRDIRISLSDLTGTAKFFDYKLSDDKPIRFFVIKSSDGVYRAALDACDTCYHAKKGYHQEGDDMVCNNCGLHFHSSQINEVHGGCNPVGLPRTIEGNQLVIKASELESRGEYF